MIKDELIKYKNITEAIIVNIKNDLDIEEFMKKREEILKSLLENNNFKKEEIKNMYLDLKLDNLDKSLKEELNKAIEKNKEEIRQIKIKRSANKAYSQNVNKINFLNKKF